jgi:hypothetical protein
MPTRNANALFVGETQACVCASVLGWGWGQGYGTKQVSDSSEVCVFSLVKKKGVSRAFFFQKMTSQSLYLDMLTN